MPGWRLQSWSIVGSVLAASSWPLEQDRQLPRTVPTFKIQDFLLHSPQQRPLNTKSTNVIPVSIFNSLKRNSLKYYLTLHFISRYLQIQTWFWILYINWNWWCNWGLGWGLCSRFFHGQSELFGQNLDPHHLPNSVFCLNFRCLQTNPSLPFVEWTQGNTVRKESSPRVSLQHWLLFITVYVDVGQNDGDMATLRFAFTGDSDIRMFDIKVSQIPCGSIYA